MLIHAGIFTCAFLCSGLAVGLLLLRVFLPYGQHRGASDGALAVSRLREEAEARAHAKTGRHRAVEPSPRRMREPAMAVAA